jgi:hypothetical protein
MAEQTPRINAKYLEKFVNHTVRIVGKVTELHGESAKIDASGTINLILTRVSCASRRVLRRQWLI